jgi:hypothetical protein
LVEHGSEKPGVVSSILTLGTRRGKELSGGGRPALHAVAAHPRRGRVLRCGFEFSSAADLMDVRQGGGTVGAVFAGLPSWWRWTYPALAVFWIALAVGKAVTGHTVWAMMYGVLAAGWVALTLVAFLRPQGWRR